MTNWRGCLQCRYLVRHKIPFVCKAFPEGIPIQIASGEMDHLSERSGQVPGVLFEQKKDLAEKSVQKFNPNHDEHGRFSSSGAGGYLAAPRELASVRSIVGRKVASAPVPSAQAVTRARAELTLAKRGEGRPGGESRGGSARDRQAQKVNLFKEFGGEARGYVVDHGTGLKMHYSSDPKLNPNNYPVFERGKIFTKVQGGGYQLPNLIPESFHTNRTRDSKPVRQENLS